MGKYTLEKHTLEKNTLEKNYFGKQTFGEDNFEKVTFGKVAFGKVPFRKIPFRKSHIRKSYFHKSHYARDTCVSKKVLINVKEYDLQRSKDNLLRVAAYTTSGLSSIYWLLDEPTALSTAYHHPS